MVVEPRHAYATLGLRLAGLALSFSVLVGAQGAAWAADGKLDEIKKRGHMIAGVRIESSRFGALDTKTNEIKGFDVDIINAVSRVILGNAKPVELVSVTSQNRITQLNTDRVDALAATVTISQQRMREIAYSNVYLRVGQSLLVRKDSTIQSYKDLSKRKVCATTGSTPAQTIRKMVADAEILNFTTDSEGFLALKAKRCEAYTTGYLLLMDMEQSDPNMKIVGGKFTFEAWGIGVKAGNDSLVTAINDALAKIKASGEYASIYKKWLDTTLPDDFDSWYGMAPAEAAKRFAESAQ
ncbi:MAG: transporter substrate-binding domain-containing protein [Enhydrobacter sp.]